jgi:hypothetical protein
MLVWTEQGLGDALMFMRYLPILKQRGLAELSLHCFDSLVRLAGCIPALDRVVSDAAPLLTRGAFDYHCPIMSLPRWCGTRRASIPSKVPYLEVPAAHRRRWAERLPKGLGPKIGVAWFGGPLFRDNSARSIALERLAPLLEIQGLQWVSLQKGSAQADLRRLGWPVLDLMDECTDLLDTAALIENLDLVVSVCTSIPNLAGALGKPVWLLNRCESEWRWLLRGETTPWYPTARVFRQPSPGDWESVVRQVASELTSL